MSKAGSCCLKCGTFLWELRRRPLGNPFLIEPWHSTGSTPGLRAGLQGEGHCQRGLPARCRPVFIQQKSSQRLSVQLVGEPSEMDFQQDHNIERSFFILRRLPKIFCLCFYSLLFYIATKKKLNTSSYKFASCPLPEDRALGVKGKPGASSKRHWALPPPFAAVHGRSSQDTSY